MPNTAPEKLRSTCFDDDGDALGLGAAVGEGLPGVTV